MISYFAGSPLIRVRREARSIRGCAAALAWLALAGALSAGAPPATDAAPALVSTGSAPKWKNDRELQAAAEAGDPEASFAWGDRLLEGVGRPADPAAAVPFFERAAQADRADAWFRLGKIFHEGLGVPRDYARGFGYFVEAARRGVPEAQHNVGAMLVSGRGVKRDYAEGLAWLIVAEKFGAMSMAQAQVRARLAKRPAEIAKGERRAAELLAEIETKGAATPKAALKESAAAPAEERFRPAPPPPPQVKVEARPEAFRPAAPALPTLPATGTKP